MKSLHIKDSKLKEYFFLQLIFVIIIAIGGLHYFLNIEQDAQAKTLDIVYVPASFNGLAESVTPAVVNIRTEKTVTGGGPVFKHYFNTPDDQNDPFNDFFEHFFGNGNQHEYKQQSLGSGFIIDNDGFIITNNHVIENADKIKVKLNNGKEFDAEIIGRDPNTDIALIKIKSWKGLPNVTLGNSDELKVGEWVVAIGSPFGLEHTVTAGIVSAKGRVIGSGPYEDFIQTDASINPGNSGGPLINMKGEVIGINTAIVAGGQGIGFAVPVNMAENIIEQLKNHGEVTRGWLGVAIQDINDEMAEYYGLKEKKGVLVGEAFKGDPADKAGIRSGDIVLKVNGKNISTSRELTQLIADISVGDKADIEIWREGKIKNFEVTITKREEAKPTASHTDKKESTFGIRVTDLTPEMAKRFHIDNTGGVIVTGLDPEGKGSAAGIRTGDMITEVNHQRINSVDEYMTALEKIKPGETVYLYIKRGNSGYQVIKLTK